MITDILLSVFSIIIGFLISPLTLLNDVVLDPNIISAVSNINGIIATVNPVFPITTLFSILAIITGIELAIFIYKGIYWLIKKIPTIS